MQPEPTTVFLIESSQQTRALVADFLGGSDLVRIVGCASDWSNAAAGIQDSDPDVVIVDRFPGPELSAIGCCLVIHATSVPERTAAELRTAGICAVVFKEVGMMDDLLSAILHAADVCQR